MNVISHMFNAAIGVFHSGFSYKLLSYLWLWFVELCKAKSICGILKMDGFSLALVNITVNITDLGDTSGTGIHKIYITVLGFILGSYLGSL